MQSPGRCLLLLEKSLYFTQRYLHFLCCLGSAALSLGKSLQFT